MSGDEPTGAVLLLAVPKHKEPSGKFASFPLTASGPLTIVSVDGDLVNLRSELTGLNHTFSISHRRYES